MSTLPATTPRQRPRSSAPKSLWGEMLSSMEESSSVDEVKSSSTVRSAWRAASPNVCPVPIVAFVFARILFGAGHVEQASSCVRARVREYVLSVSIAGMHKCLTRALTFVCACVCVCVCARVQRWFHATSPRRVHPFTQAARCAHTLSDTLTAPSTASCAVDTSTANSSRSGTLRVVTPRGAR
jgi:hypothetical protein